MLEGLVGPVVRSWGLEFLFFLDFVEDVASVVDHWVLGGAVFFVGFSFHYSLARNSFDGSTQLEFL